MSILKSELCKGSKKEFDSVASRLKKEADVDDNLVVKKEWDDTFIKTEVMEFNSVAGYFTDEDSFQSEKHIKPEQTSHLYKDPSEDWLNVTNVLKTEIDDHLEKGNKLDETFIKTEFMTENKSDFSEVVEGQCNTNEKIEIGNPSKEIGMETSHAQNGETSFCLPYKSNERNTKKDSNLSKINEKTLICGLCTYKTNSSAHLKRHILTHTKLKPFSCVYCDYRTNYASTLKLHINVHNGIKLYSCKDCSYKTNYKAHLRRHFLTHTGEKPFICGICTFKTSDPSTLKRHIYYHSGNKPYSCENCHYKTNNTRSLRVHNFIHTREKPYSCALCPLKTSSNSTLRRHRRKVHGQRYILMTGNTPVLK